MQDVHYYTMSPKGTIMMNFKLGNKLCLKITILDTYREITLLDTCREITLLDTYREITLLDTYRDK